MKRPSIPVWVKLRACLYALGLDPDDTEFDHHPALGLRPYDLVTGKFDPDANDPRYIVPRRKADHAIKTNGTRSIPLSGDKAKIAKTKRIREKQDEFKKMLLAKGQEEPPPKSKWAKRPFPKREKSNS